jgi:hypothetical protein
MELAAAGSSVRRDKQSRLADKLSLILTSRQDSRALTSFSQYVVFLAPSGLKSPLICAHNVRILQHSKSDFSLFSGTS